MHMHALVRLPLYELNTRTIIAVSPEGSIQVNPIAINGNDSGIATFTCMALGGPENIFSWTKVRDNRNITNDSELMLVDIMASDGGVYQCTVKNLAGSENDTVTLNGNHCNCTYMSHNQYVHDNNYLFLPYSFSSSDRTSSASECDKL